jgi:hypothetical protein
MNPGTNARPHLLVISAITVAILASCGNGNESVSGASVVPSATEAAATSEAPESTMTAIAARPSDPVVEYYAALNAEDVDRIGHVWPTGNDEFFEMVTGAFHGKVSATCSPGQAVDTDVECIEEWGRHDFYTPAGITPELTVIFTIQGGHIVARDVVGVPTAVDDYEAAVGAWLETSHPDVFAGSYAGSSEAPFGTTEDALAVIALLPEFFAQSDTYPLDGSS